MPNLRYVNVRDTRITAQGLRKLLESDSLETISIRPTMRLSPQAILSLQRLKPGVIRIDQVQ